ncbi:MAG: hypothetical protein COS90_11900 [Deltaproteobacteria bacterium CG07_land_8_20_14_0_80_60_11]|nr:MAG: hypothetical protein COS90_11900 [Deltaproteobacteria bacterium CG07_land_8_20_14_0_80_60_11]
MFLNHFSPPFFDAAYHQKQRNWRRGKCICINDSFYKMRKLRVSSYSIDFIQNQKNPFYTCILKVLNDFRKEV